MTPMEKQYNQMKKEYPDALLLFRLGDFYECFQEDAVQAAKVLGITLTSRGKGEKSKPMAGIPYHSLDNYLPKLLKAGVKVALAEQVEPVQTGKLVERKIVKVYTPGTVTDEKTLDPGSNNYLASIYKDSSNYGVAFVDISTGELKVFETKNTETVKQELNRISPSEIICTISQYEDIKELSPVRPQQIDQTPFLINNSTKTVQEHFKVNNLKGFGISESESIVCALGGLINYIRDCQKTDLSYLDRLSVYNFSEFMKVDSNTISNLELIYSSSGNNQYTLLSVLDQCSSTMGKRKLRNWVLRPYKDKELITERLDSVELLIKEIILNDNLRKTLKNVYDIERILSRIGLASANARDLISLARSLEQVDDIVFTVENVELPNRLKHLIEQLKSTSEIAEVLKLIQKSIHPEPPTTIGDGSIINDGYDERVDELRSLSKNSKQILAQMQQSEIEKTGIPSLKISYNKVFGYYIEVTKTHTSKVPETYIRKQTLANAERYITPELKEIEDKILNAEEQLNQLEYQIFTEVRETIAKDINILLAVADVIAEIDVLSNFAYVSRQNEYSRPIFSDEASELKIVEGRHPVVENAVSKFTANNLDLNGKDKLVILTGPNMSGKSTYIRQIAIIVHMAQMGCYVPATMLKLSPVDRIFTRVGASDNLSTGESTFMVEMNETANILNNATEKSLIILDEVGRGTSTYDGVAIAWAIVEHIHNEIDARTIFATHYHELIQLEETLSNVTNYKVEVQESGKEIEFSHKISVGSTSKSYGVHVAKIAGVPKVVVNRAEQILDSFESTKEDNNEATKKDIKKVPKPKKIPTEQIGFL